MLSNTLAAALGLAAVANAHMFLATPVRFTEPSATNGPISYGNFPCQSTAATYAGPTSTMSLGSDQPLAFQGQSVHGGGSCQISITYDENPTRDSVWKVIKSFEGGCPARNTAGNIGADNSATAADPFTYNFTIPDNIPSGSGTLAWSWLNNVGNREFYMQCAAIELSGTGGDQSNYDALPDMFVANLGTPDSCTVETGDFVYPDPGTDVEYGNGAKPSGADLATTAGSCTVGVGSGSGSGASGAATTAAATTSAAAVGGGVFATSGGVAPSATAAITSENTATAVVPAATGTGSSSSGSGSSGSSSSGSSSGSSSSSSSGSVQSGACSTDGEYVCLGTSYQVCASGQWSVEMSLASGTSCTGTGANFEIAASKQKSRFRKTRAERKKRGMPAMFNLA